jgi:hypothetical protein
MAATFSALFIDDQYLRDYTPMGQNIDPLTIYPFVEDSQDVYIQDLLGTPLYMDLTYKLYTGVTYSTNERTIVDLCSKALAYYSVYMALPHLAIKIRNVGVARPTSDNTQPSTMEELKYIREEMKNMGEFWSERIVRYLCENSTLYPLYDASTDDMSPSPGQYDSDIYLSPYGNYTEAERKFLDQYYRSR